MCIFQDSLDDWSSQAAEMGLIYAGAICNIAATAAKNSSIGLFFDRQPQWSHPFRVTHPAQVSCSRNSTDQALIKNFCLYPNLSWENDVEDSVLNERAWVVQERFLSARVIHFSANQVYWECLQTLASETFPNSLPVTPKPHWMSNFPLVKYNLWQVTNHDQLNAPLEDDRYRAWQALVRIYSACDLTKDKDKLVAIAGVVRVLSRTADDDFVCGLYKPRFLEELCWYRSDSRLERQFHVNTWRAPSWSWAAHNVTALPSSVRHHIACQELKTLARVASIDVEKDVFGQVSYASIRLVGKLLDVSLTRTRKPELVSISRDGVSIGDSLLSPEFPLISINVRLDDQSTEYQKTFQFEVTLVPMFSCECSWPHAQSPRAERIFALILQRCPAGDNKYTRLGFGEFYGDGAQFISDHMDRHESTILVE